jgi:hypothetical protein
MLTFQIISSGWQSGRFFKQALSTVAVLVLLAGCSKSNTTSPRSGTGTGEKQESSALTDCVALWSAGNQEAAIEKFLAIDWNDALLFPSGTPLAYAERDLASLSENQLRQDMGEIESIAKALKEMSLRIKQLGEEARAAGNSTEAETCFNSLGKCGTALDQPNRLKILQLVGKAIKKMAGQ